jgi:hypothetical protein
LDVIGAVSFQNALSVGGTTSLSTTSITGTTTVTGSLTASSTLDLTASTTGRVQLGTALTTGNIFIWWPNTNR